MDKRTRVTRNKIDTKTKKEDHRAPPESNGNPLESKFLIWKENSKHLEKFDFLNVQLFSDYLGMEVKQNDSNFKKEENFKGSSNLKNASKYLNLINYIYQHYDASELDGVLHNIAFIYGIDKDILKQEALAKKKPMKKAPRNIPIDQYLKRLIEADMIKSNIKKFGEPEIILLPGLKIKVTPMSKMIDDHNEFIDENEISLSLNKKTGSKQEESDQGEIKMIGGTNMKQTSSSRGLAEKRTESKLKAVKARSQEEGIDGALRKKIKSNHEEIKNKEKPLPEEDNNDIQGIIEKSIDDKKPMTRMTKKKGIHPASEEKGGKKKNQTKQNDEKNSSEEESKDSMTEQYMELYINNEVDDDEGESFSFFYVNDNLYNKTKHYFEKRLKPEEICSCAGGCDDPLICPCARFNFENCGKTSCYVYDTKYGKKRLLHQLIKKDMHIYECSSQCACSKSLCLNSCVNEGDANRQDVKDFVVERYKKVYNGQDPKLLNFSATMWGLKTRVFIPTNTYVVEYCGEIITKKEGDKRGEKYDSVNCNYLFDLNKHVEIEKVDEPTNTIFMNVDGVCETRSISRLKDMKENFPLVIDAFFYGNHSRFVNHSCSPNMVALAVHVENRDILVPRIIYFALRDIQPGEELTIDYNCAPLKDLKNTDLLVCLCGAPNCRGFVYEEGQEDSECERCQGSNTKDSD